ncbi:ABC transporter permease [Galactobacter caseinivorans]|uniref:Transport permease protein n=1 Tax=Galactobacter caseinivorans TaxID=2676123 RepID=A0A496PJD6_9MICC|nr:ABC transporter permease [Galactobacter caseinivorans]RKW70579.1 ABC transporter [Galactobacter caseinivorans]
MTDPQAAAKTAASATPGTSRAKELIPQKRAFGALYGRNARSVMERSWMATKNATWVVILSGFLEPVLYLASMGYGLGPAIGDLPGPGGSVLTYAAFIAPALLATSAMNGALFDSNNMFFKLNHSKLYRVMLFTSLGPLDVVIGEVIMALLRGLLYAVGFAIIAFSAGLITNPWGLLMIPGAVLIAFAFSALFMGLITFIKRFQQLDWINMLTMPMFLFSATFFPLTVYPQAVQWVIQALPLWHGVELLRQLSVGYFDVSMLWHVLYFVIMAALGLTMATTRLRKLFLR